MNPLTPDAGNPILEDDGLLFPEVGPWSEDKHRKVAYYASVFATAMKKVDCLVFLDLFAGAGKAKIKDTEKIIVGSPLLALGLENPFSRYLFCELVSTNAEALRARIGKHYPHIEAKVLNVDVNKEIDKVFQSIPRFDSAFKGLTFCFVDPFKAENLKFKTLERLAERLYIDFMVLIPSFMDFKRNAHNYTRKENKTLDDFLGTDSWRERWEEESKRLGGFGVFIANKFGEQMRKLRYKYSGPEMFETIRINEEKGLFLYHLGFFSRHDLGVKFWEATRENTRNQMRLAL